MADGENADVDDIQSKDNLDVGGQYAFVNGNGDILEKNIATFREFLIAKVQNDPSKIKEVENKAVNSNSIFNGKKVVLTGKKKHLVLS